jgi:3-oxoacyl-(acyl-carrier-protein) synthase
MSRTRVVVTGMGTTSPVGGDVASTWEAMLAGRSGVRHLTDDWAAEMPVKIARDIAETGNTSAASIPLALDRMIDEGEAVSGDKALLIAFGAGLAYAAQVVTVP